MSDARAHGPYNADLSGRSFLGCAAGRAAVATAGGSLSGPLEVVSGTGGAADLFRLWPEEHVATPELMRRNGIRFPKGTPRFDMADAGAGRVAEMDASGIGMQVLSAQTGEDRVMFAVDYPLASNRVGADWRRAVGLPRAAKVKIAHANAAKLLGIGPV